MQTWHGVSCDFEFLIMRQLALMQEDHKGITLTSEVNVGTDNKSQRSNGTNQAELRRQSGCCLLLGVETLRLLQESRAKKAILIQISLLSFIKSSKKSGLGWVLVTRLTNIEGSPVLGARSSQCRHICTGVSNRKLLPWSQFRPLAKPCVSE